MLNAMSLCGILDWNLPLIKQSHSHLIGTFPILSTLKKPTQLFSCSQSPASCSSSSSVVRWRERLRGSLGRRMFNLSICGLLSSLDLAFSRILLCSEALASPLLELERYSDSKEGFTLLVPSSWIKESTKEAEVISVSERVGHAGLQVYEFEYKVDSTRGGMKRVFSAAFATSKKLYLLNITQSDRVDNPLEMKQRLILEQVLHSFNAIPST